MPQNQIDNLIGTQKKKDIPKGEKISIMDRINNFLLKLSRVPIKEKIFFVKHLAVMLKAGISLSISIKTLSNQSENKLFESILKDVADKVEKGTSFADSLKPHKKIFGELFISMIEAGEMSGKLEDVLAQIFLQMKKEHTLMSKVKGALTYPAIIIIAVIGIGIFMIVVIIPKITSMFDEMDAQLPLATRILIGFSDALINHGIIVVIIAIVIIIIFVQTLKTYKGKYYFQWFLLHFIIIGPIIKKINLARFSRNISSLLQTDILIVKSFEITANVLGNLHYREALNDMAEKIKKGERLSEVVGNYPNLFTPVVTQMVAIGEDTGELDNILIEIADFYEEEVDQIMTNLPTIIEPLLILFLGLGVGGVAMAIIMPMYSLTENI